MLTLGQAARLTGTSKTTLTRAIKGGRLTATRREDGVYAIDPAELSRVYSVKGETPVTGDATPARDWGDTVALRVEVEVLRVVLEMLREHSAELRHQRDAWQHQAESAQRQLSAPPRLLRLIKR
jgi:hypothetical protein